MINYPIEQEGAIDEASLRQRIRAGLAYLAYMRTLERLNPGLSKRNVNDGTNLSVRQTPI